MLRRCISVSLCPYQNSPFCRGLSAEDKQVLCPECRIFQFRRKADAQESCRAIAKQLPANVFRNVIILEGIQCTNSSQNPDSPKSYLLWQPGDIMHPEVILGAFDEIPNYYHRNYITNGAYAILPSLLLRERFLSNPQFAAFLFNSVARTHNRQTSFLLGTQLQDARSALTFLLLFCQENRLPALTHQDFAYLTGLNRTTVTKMLKKILMSENLRISLKDYILSMYEDG